MNKPSQSVSRDQWREIRRRQRVGGYIAISREFAEEVAEGRIQEHDAISGSQRSAILLIREVVGRQP